MIKRKKEKTVKDILNIFLPKIWVLLVVGAIFASAMGVYTAFLKKDTYTTTTEVMVSVDTTSGGSNNSQTNQFAQQVVKSYEKVIFGLDFLEEICGVFQDEAKLKLCFDNDVERQTVISEINKLYGENGISVSSLKSMISVKTDANTPTFVLKVTSGNRIVAWAVSQVLVHDIKLGALDRYVNSNLVSAVYSSPEDNYETIRPNGKNTIRNSAIAFAIGFMVAAAAVWVHSMFDIVIRDVAKIEDNIDVPILGVIPRHEISGEEGKKK